MSGWLLVFAECSKEGRTGPSVLRINKSAYATEGRGLVRYYSTVTADMLLRRH
jgi:hypothetical protein